MQTGGRGLWGGVVMAAVVSIPLLASAGVAEPPRVTAKAAIVVDAHTGDVAHEVGGGRHGGIVRCAQASGAQLWGGVQTSPRCMPAARPLPEITRAILRDASSIISSPSMTAPRAPPCSEV